MTVLLAMIIALAAFSWQTVACHVEHAGIVPCHDQAADSTHPAAEPDGDCCHSSPEPVALASASVIDLGYSDSAYHDPYRGIPEAPVLEIEYPPQLLS
jgi:hypothetical protein